MAQKRYSDFAARWRRWAKAGHCAVRPRWLQSKPPCKAIQIFEEDRCRLAAGLGLAADDHIPCRQAFAILAEPFTNQAAQAIALHGPGIDFAGHSHAQTGGAAACPGQKDASEKTRSGSFALCKARSKITTGPNPGLAWKALARMHAANGCRPPIRAPPGLRRSARAIRGSGACGPWRDAP